MAIQIIREGVDLRKMPKDVHVCPACGEEARIYNLREQPGKMIIPKPPYLPTFECAKCQCVWQWKPDIDEKENENQENNS